MAWRQGLPYGQDLRDRVLAARDAGQSVRAVIGRPGAAPVGLQPERPVSSCTVHAGDPTGQLIA